MARDAQDIRDELKRKQEQQRLDRKLKGELERILDEQEQEQTDGEDD